MPIPVETRTAAGLGRPAHAAERQLHDVASQVDGNLDKKAAVRDAKALLARYLHAKSEGDVRLTAELKTALVAHLMGASLGFDANAPEVRAAQALPKSAELMETLLDSRASGYADVGQKLLFELQQSNNTFTRANTMASNVLHKYGAALDGIVRNMKG